MLGMVPKIYRYVVRHDGGTAPRPFGGVCTLAICKPRIRATALPGDWIIGFRSRHPAEVVYVMQVTERMPLGEYWEDPRFRDRRPDASPYPDNFYRIGADGKPDQVSNDIHSPKDVARDVRGANVLIGEKFWYFGRNSVRLLDELDHLVHTTQGHVVHKNRRANDVDLLKGWLAAFPPGMHGSPIDREVNLGEQQEVGFGGSPGAKPVKTGCGASARKSMPTVRSGMPVNRRSSRRDSTSSSRIACASDSRASPRKLVLSRKGFDSSYGGMASPILPDGRLLALPIPAARDDFTLGDVEDREIDMAGLLSDLSGGRHSLETRIHLDPDLDRPAGRRLPRWRPSLGQTGNAQSHLQAQGVGAGDLFLFFGWFREVERFHGRWRFAPRAPNQHVLFGWLEVDECLSIVAERADCLSRHPWIADHPHVSNPAHYADKRNMLYIAPAISAYGHRAGGGLFSHFSKRLGLTAEGCSRSVWSLPAWFFPAAGKMPLTFHAAPDRWSPGPDYCRLRTVAKGQEFVLDTASYPEANNWAHDIVATHQ